MLPREFYMTDAVSLAKSLIGKVLVRQSSNGIAAGIISETEAYMGVIDKAAHTYGGKRTARTETMYLPGGHAYVYLIYGIYSCMNITANIGGNPQAVLIRGVIPIYGFDLMLENYAGFMSRRNQKHKFNADKYKVKQYKISDGPGKLCAAMDIDRSLDKADMCQNSSYAPLYAADLGIVPSNEPSASPRIGIDYAEEAALFPWRFTSSDFTSADFSVIDGIIVKSN